VVLTRNLLLDTGPLVSVLDSRDQCHARCLAVWPSVIHRCLTTEPVVTEACHLALRGGGFPHAPLDFLLSAGIPIIALEAGGHRLAASLMGQYASLPMDFADASLVALGEALDITTVFTTDRRGFGTYRLARGKQFTLVPQG